MGDGMGFDLDAEGPMGFTWGAGFAVSPGDKARGNETVDLFFLELP